MGWGVMQQATIGNHRRLLNMGMSLASSENKQKGNNLH
jgi:hypothetical protein